MKKLLYSKTLKIIAVLLVIVYCAIGAYQLADLALWDRDSLSVYNYDASFGDSSHVYALLHQAEWQVDSYLRGEEKNMAVLDEALAALSAEEKVYYYVSVNGQVLTDYEGVAEELCALAHYKKTQIGADGSVSMETDLKDAYCFMDVPAGIEVLVISALRPAYADGTGILWEMEERQFFDRLLRLSLTALLFLLLFVYLVAVAGRDKGGERKSPWIDLVYTEVHLAFLVGTILGGAFLWCALVGNDAPLLNRLWIPLSLLIGGVTGGLALTSSLALTRKIKHRSFLKNSVIFLLLRGLWRLTVRVWKATARGMRSLRRVLGRTVFQKTAMIFGTFLLLYTAVIAICGIVAPRNPLAILFGVLLYVAACFFLAYRGADLDQVKMALRRVREGDFHTPAQSVKCEDLKQMAEDVGGIADGMEQSVAERVRAERMKTELITNVSHDLKTPLTSIISYTELLAGVEELPEEARDYVAVISAKSARLKKLTGDLFDISRAQSGNEEVNMERLDGALLIEQALGEYDREIEASGLTFCVSAEAGLTFQGDGRKLCRVLGNLIENILKYTMPHTRVFVRGERTEEGIRMEWKNISSYPLNFEGEEMVGRFVRGDESRSTEGNGLGLAIAKSYTELCGGTFRVVTDGDLFKVVLTFPEEMRN